MGPSERRISKRRVCHLHQCPLHKAHPSSEQQAIVSFMNIQEHWGNWQTHRRLTHLFGSTDKVFLFPLAARKPKLNYSLPLTGPFRLEGTTLLTQPTRRKPLKLQITNVPACLSVSVSVPSTTSTMGFSDPGGLCGGGWRAPRSSRARTLRSHSWHLSGILITRCLIALMLQPPDH